MTGLAEFIGKIPGLGVKIKGALLDIAANRKTLLALPNMIARAIIVPELFGKLTPETVADSAEKLLLDKDRRRQMRTQLIEVMGARGAAGRIVEMMGL